MTQELALVMPAAGRGSRFSKHGVIEPKPLINLHGRPFFWWATESVRRQVKLRQLVYVVLQEHVENFDIDKKIKSYYPDAKIVVIQEVTSGAAETARIGVAALDTSGPIAINDCDHAFMVNDLPRTVINLQTGTAGALMCFRSTNPAYSYIKLGIDGEIIGTVEKQVVSQFAIAGCYFFADTIEFSSLYKIYSDACPYDELFISGMYELMSQRGLKLDKVELERHASFGTPEEHERMTIDAFKQFISWK